MSCASRWYGLLDVTVHGWRMEEKNLVKRRRAVDKHRQARQVRAREPVLSTVHGRLKAASRERICAHVHALAWLRPAICLAVTCKVSMCPCEISPESMAMETVTTLYYCAIDGSVRLQKRC